MKGVRVMIKLCVFDLDGTLINSLYDIAKSMNYALKKNKLEQYEIEAYNMFVGNGIDNLAQMVVNKATLDEDTKNSVMEYFKKHYISHCYDNTYVYDGCYKLLTHLELRNIKIAVLSNKPNKFVRKMVKHYFPNYNFLDIRGDLEDYPNKPNPASLMDLTYKNNIRKNECIYIGDSDIDVLTAKNADMHFCGCEWGFRGFDELSNAGAKFIIKQPIHLLRVIDNINQFY